MTIRGNWSTRSWPLRSLSLFMVLISQHFVSGISDLSDSKNATKTAFHSTSSRNTGTKVVIIILVFVVVGLFSILLFKLWQRKKREEQYARLLKLFEEDDELEVELGLRD